MTPAEIAQTKRLLKIAYRNYVHYSMKVRTAQQAGKQPSAESVAGVADNERYIRQYERELEAAGVEVEV
jgi:hypothetical protein